MTFLTKILMLMGKKGARFMSPYIDVHGEEDPNLEKGKQLYLNEYRLRHLEQLFLRGKILYTCSQGPRSSLWTMT